MKHEESFKVAKTCQIWEQVLQLPNVNLTNQVSEQLIDWIVEVLKHENHLILTDILSCLAVAVNFKEVKQTKVSLKHLETYIYLYTNHGKVFLLKLGIGESAWFLWIIDQQIKRRTTNQ